MWTQVYGLILNLTRNLAYNYVFWRAHIVITVGVVRNSHAHTTHLNTHTHTLVDGLDDISFICLPYCILIFMVVRVLPRWSLYLVNYCAILLHLPPVAARSSSFKWHLSMCIVLGVCVCVCLPIPISIPMFRTRYLAQFIHVIPNIRVYGYGGRVAGWYGGTLVA